MGRRAIPVDVKKIEELAGLGLTQGEIARCLGISTDTLERRKRDSAGFAAALKNGRARGAQIVANKLMELCKRGNLGAIVWYEKTRTNRIERTESDNRIIIEYVRPKNSPARASRNAGGSDEQPIPIQSVGLWASLGQDNSRNGDSD